MSNKQSHACLATDEASSTQTVMNEFANLRRETDRQFETWLRTLNDRSLIADDESPVVNETSDYFPANPREIKFEGTLHVDGYVSGFIYSPNGKLLITATGEVDGDISVDEAFIDGQVRGDISAPKSVMLGSKARVIGNIETCALSIQPGAAFQGQCTFPAVIHDDNSISEPIPQKARAASAVN